MNQGAFSCHDGDMDMDGHDGTYVKQQRLAFVFFDVELRSSSSTQASTHVSVTAYARSVIGEVCP